MADIVVPKLSATMEEARVLKWLKPLGAAVKPGDALVELETDKAALEVEATEGGELAEILVAEGDMAAIGAVLARIAEHGGTQGAPKAGKPASAGATAASAPLPDRVSTSAETPRARPRLVNASPLARRLARERGIDLASLKGSAAGGRIQAADLRAVLDAGGAAASTAPSAQRRRIAARVIESRRNLPSFWLDRWVAVTAAEAAIEKARAAGALATFTDILLRAMAEVAARHVKFRQIWSEQALREIAGADDVSVGLVVATADGVAIPVLSGLAGASLARVTELRRRAVEQARAGRVSEAMLRPAALSLSNLSSSGIDRFEAIVDPEQSAILAAGRIHERVVPISGGVGVARGCHLTLSVDHRLIDGRDGAAFLADLAEAIERPQAT